MAATCPGFHLATSLFWMVNRYLVATGGPCAGV